MAEPKKPRSKGDAQLTESLAASDTQARVQAILDLRLTPSTGKNAGERQRDAEAQKEQLLRKINQQTGLAPHRERLLASTHQLLIEAPAEYLRVLSADAAVTRARANREVSGGDDDRLPKASPSTEPSIAPAGKPAKRKPPK